MKKPNIGSDQLSLMNDSIEIPGEIEPTFHPPVLSGEPANLELPEVDYSLADKGLISYGHARLLAGIALEPCTTPPQQSAAPRPQPPKKLDRRSLSPRHKMIADEPPEHIRNLMGRR